MSHDILMPRLSQDMETGQVVEWLKAVDDPVEAGEPLLVVETDKANLDVEAPASGVLRRIVAKVGTDVAIGGLLGVIASADEVLSDDERPSPSAVPASSAVPRVAAAPSPAHAARQPSSPAARRAAAELGVDISLVRGRGEGGLVSEGDVRGYAKESASAVTAEGPRAAEPVAGEEVTEVPLLGMRRRSAERLALSRRTVADVTTVIDVDMAAVVAHRSATRHPYTAYVAWATAQALAAFPMLNASFAEDRVLLHHAIHLGVAVALDEGLVVPVVRHADRLGLAEMASAIETLSDIVRRGEASPEQLRGSTFTLSNSGTFGSLFFTPIVNLPEAAILGMGRVAEVPVVRDGAVVAGTVMYLCLSYDHRAVDGADAVRFLADIKRRLESIPEGAS